MHGRAIEFGPFAEINEAHAGRASAGDFPEEMYRPVDRLRTPGGRRWNVIHTAFKFK